MNRKRSWRTKEIKELFPVGFMNFKKARLSRPRAFTLCPVGRTKIINKANLKVVRYAAFSFYYLISQSFSWKQKR